MTSRGEAPTAIPLKFLRYAAYSSPEGYERRGYDSHDDSGRPYAFCHKMARDHNGRLKKFKLRNIMVPFDTRDPPRWLSRQAIEEASLHQRASIARDSVIQPASVTFNSVKQHSPVAKLESDGDRNASSVYNGLEADYSAAYSEDYALNFGKQSSKSGQRYVQKRLKNRFKKSKN